MHRGEEVLVLPPRRKELHFLLGTRSSRFLGYGWPPDPALMLEAARSPSLNGVIVIHGLLDDTDRDTWRAMNVDDAIAALRRQGFEPAMELRTMTLWRRGPGYSSARE